MCNPEEKKTNDRGLPARYVYTDIYSLKFQYFLFIKVKKIKIFKMYFVLSKVQIMFWFRKGMVVVSPTHLNFVHFEFDSFIYCN